MLELGEDPVSYALKDFLKSKHTQINRISQTKQTFSTDRGIKIILAPESHKAFLNSYFPME